MRISAGAIGADSVRDSQTQEWLIIGGVYITGLLLYGTTRGKTRERWRHRLHVARLPANVEGNVFVLDHVSEKGRRQR